MERVVEVFMELGVVVVVKLFAGVVFGELSSEVFTLLMSSSSSSLSLSSLSSLLLSLLLFGVVVVCDLGQSLRRNWYRV